MSVYAVAEIAGLQYKVTKGLELETQMVSADKDKIFETDKVLLVKSKDKTLIGSPYVKGASLICEVVRDFRGEKTVAYKFRKRKKSESKKGHRQSMSLLRVKEIKVA